MDFSIDQIDPTQASHIEAVAGLWTGACGHALATSPRTVAYNLRSHGTSPTQQEGAFVWCNEEPVGALLIDSSRSPLDESPQTGYISLLAVLPEMQQKQVGSKLLDWAEEKLHASGCKSIQLGGNANSFVPGYPTELSSDPFFVQRGYQRTTNVWDMAANLAGYQPPPTVREVDAAIRTAQPANIDDMQAFLQRESLSHCTLEFEQFLNNLQTPGTKIQGRAERISDYMILWTERGIDGLSRLNFEDSYRPIELVYPYQLPRPWGQVGHFIISEDIRGQGFGAALIDASLRRMHNNGVNGCIINATTTNHSSVDLYAKFGFTPSREYAIFQKVIR